MRVRLAWGSVTDTGRVREANEDSLLVAEPLFVVADGMGGHAAGEVASGLAVETLRQAFGPDHPPTVDGIVAAVRQANRDIVRQSLDTPTLRGMGTTLTGIALLEGGGAARVAVFNVGDSRTYRLREGALARVTTDHSYVQELINRGEITPAEARVHPHRNIVTRALGVDPEVDVDATEELVVAGDRYLLCSDGLVDELDDVDIERVLATVPDPQAAADELAQRANASGGRDNITVIVVDIVEVNPLGGWVGDEQPPADTSAVPAPTSPPEPVVPSPKPAKRRRPAIATFVIGLAIVAVLAAAFGAIQLYGRGGYYLAFEGANVAVFQGRPGGVLWIDPTLSATYPLTRSELTDAGASRVEVNPTFGSRAAADRYVANLQADPAALVPPPTTTSSSTTTSTSSTTTSTTTTTTAAPPST